MLEAFVKGVEMSITMRLSGGLGNQLHQVAAGVAMAGSIGTSLVLDRRTINLGSNSQRYFELDGFDFNSMKVYFEFLGKETRIRSLASRVSRKLLKNELFWLAKSDFIENQASVKEQVSNVGDGYTVSGHFVDFEWIYLAEAFGFLPKVREENVSTKAKEISSRIHKEDIAIHLRFGDFLKNPSLFPLVTDSYIKEALQLLSNFNRIWIYTDDMTSAGKYCQEILKRSYCVLSPQDISSLDTFWLLGQYQRLVTSNSTFSSLAAYLAPKKISDVVTPIPHLYAKWKDNLPSDWHRVELLKS
jgi:hypothetical protein